MIITRTPFRISFFGGGTDYQPWFSQHGGLVVGTTFQRFCYISCRLLPPFFEYKTRILYSRTETVNRNNQIQHPAIRGCLQFLGIEDGLEIHHDGDLPARSGLGSSSAFTVGFLLALHVQQHRMLTKRDLANKAIKVEQDVLKENVGIQDQILTSHGGMLAIQIDRSGSYETTPIVLSPDYRHAFEEHILLGFTGFTRDATKLSGIQMEGIREGKVDMSEIHSIAQEGWNFLMKQADFTELGKLLDDSWSLKRGLVSGITNSFVDELYKRAKKTGAYGGKLLGAGGGGFMMFLAPPSQHQRIKEALKEIKVWVPFKMNQSGAQVVFHTDEA